MTTSHASFWEAVTGAVHSLRGNKLRSFLTLLGIILATTTLISVMSVISGMDRIIAENVSNMGADGYTVTRIFFTGRDPKKFLDLLRRNPNLNKEEFEFLREHVSLSREIGMTTNRSVTLHGGKETSEGVGLTGCTPNMAIIANYEAVEGHFISETENDRHMNIAFIGNDVRTKFFGEASPIGHNINVEGIPFEVVGVAKTKGSVFGQSQDNFVVIPIETYFKTWGSRSGMNYAATAVDHAHLIQAQEEARMMLRSYRHLGPKDDDSFSMLTSDALLDFWNQLTGAIAATAVGVVSVFMVVGGVVIMNIMLAVVTERTHEIGIRKSVGARRQDILNQFLVESSMLSGMGGLIGVTIAWIVAVLVRNLTAVPMSVPVTAVIVGVTLSATVGLFFGIYPAQRASKLDPIEALRAGKMTISSLNNGIRMALATTVDHKMRSFLTILGVIIGTGAVIGVGSIIAGLDGAITGLLRSFGPTTVIVTKTAALGNSTREERRRKPLTLENARAIEARCPAVEHVSPYLMPGGGLRRTRYKGNDYYGIQMAGTEEGYAYGGTTMKYGRFFTDIENTHHMPVVVIGEDIQKRLLPEGDPVGKWIDVDGHEFEVIGVMDRPATSLPGSDDNRVLIPYFTMRKMFPNATEHMLIAIAYTGMVEQAEDQIRTVLRLERRVPYHDPDTFAITTAEQMIEQFHSVTATVALVMVILSSIGLLVGGIGVMNIMLVSVTERTREIGIRKAIGARKSDIVVQFLTEAVVLTGLGGILGLSLGWGISMLAGLAFPNLPTAVPLWAAASGVMVSVGVGLFFGIWPAGRAARLDPVEALRYE